MPDRPLEWYGLTAALCPANGPDDAERMPWPTSGDAAWRGVFGWPERSPWRLLRQVASSTIV